MDGIESKSIRFFLPASADEFVGGKAAESLESFGEVVGSDEVAEMNAQLAMAVVVVALNRGFFDGAVHTLDLAVGPGWFGLVSRWWMPCGRQVRSKGCPRKRAVGPFRFFGRSANWMPLSVSTVWMR